MLVLTTDAVPGHTEWREGSIGVPTQMEDPGDQGQIHADLSSYLRLDIAGTGEESAIAAPGVTGQRLTISASVPDGGTRRLTLPGPVNADGHTDLLFSATGDTMVLVAVEVGSSLVWQLVHQFGGDTE